MLKYLIPLSLFLVPRERETIVYLYAFLAGRGGGVPLKFRVHAPRVIRLPMRAGRECRNAMSI